MLHTLRETGFTITSQNYLILKTSINSCSTFAATNGYNTGSRMSCRSKKIHLCDSTITYWWLNRVCQGFSSTQIHCSDACHHVKLYSIFYVKSMLSHTTIWKQALILPTRKPGPSHFSALCLKCWRSSCCSVFPRISDHQAPSMASDLPASRQLLCFHSLSKWLEVLIRVFRL